MKYEIEIDLPPDVAAKYVPVAFRCIEPGEWYRHGYGGAVMQWRGTAASADACLILAPRVEWPAWCSADWMFKTLCGDIYVGAGDAPHWNGKGWVGHSAAWHVPRLASADLYAAFEHVPAELSLIENPKRQKGAQ